MLRGDPKEQAEHAMIVDLMRNDLGRLARVGTVSVRDLMRVERFSDLSHLVSTIQCQTRPEVGLRDVFAATFPPGSVTGAPKPPPERISLSHSGLANSLNMLVLVTGSGKRSAVARWREGESLPVAYLECAAGVDVLLDEDAWYN